MKKILAFETSCDDTAVAIVRADGEILADEVYSQLEAHRPYGGVVPEIGSRAHIEQINVVTKEVFRKALLKPEDIDAVAATFAPGLLGPLLVGAQFAKGFAVASKLPLIAIHHIEGHILSGALTPQYCEPPFVALVVSGGHTALYECDEEYRMRLLGETRDDAAGEAFDKIGRALGLSYPAGKIIDELAQGGNIDRFHFPQPMRGSFSLEFSFSGLKTAALECLRKQGTLDKPALADFCAGLVEVVAESLVDRTKRALKKTGHRALVLGGGVAANNSLRKKIADFCQSENIKLYLPPKNLCVDNAVMIARAAHIKLRQGKLSEIKVDVMASLPIERAGELLF